MDEEKTCECIYCSADCIERETVPSVRDDAAWAELAKEHHPWCEWIVTRAHGGEAGARGWEYVDT